MSLRLNRKGTTSYINNHPALMGRDLLNQHPIRAIEGLLEALEEKYIKPESGIPKDHLGFDVATIEDIKAVQSYLQVQIDDADKGIAINADNITAIQDFLNKIFGSGENGAPHEPEINFAYRDGFRDEFIGEVGDTEFHLSNKYIADGQHLKVYRDGELLLVNQDYEETSDTYITFKEPLEIPVFITCICDSTSTVLSPIHEEITAVEGQTELNLKNTYKVGSNSLSIFIGGLRLENGTQYEEVDMETVVLKEPLAAGTKVILRQESLHACGKVLYQDNNYTQSTWQYKCVATEGQTIIDIPEVFIPDANMLMVSVDGLLQSIGQDMDFIELNEHQIQFNYPLNEGDALVVTNIIGLYNWSESYIALRGQIRYVLTNPYIMNRGDILVYENGILLSAGDDYIEVNNRTIEFTEPPYEGASILIYKRR